MHGKHGHAGMNTLCLGYTSQQHQQNRCPAMWDASLLPIEHKRPPTQKKKSSWDDAFEPDSISTHKNQKPTKRKREERARSNQATCTTLQHHHVPLTASTALPGYSQDKPAPHDNTK
jgi:hypothetical protein